MYRVVQQFAILHTVYIGRCFSIGEKFRSKDERTNVELECLMELERTDEVVERLSELLHKTPDQWSFIRTYISCQIQRYLRMKERKEKGESGGGSSTQSREGEKKTHNGGGSLQSTGEEGASASGRMAETPEDEQRTSEEDPSVQECAGTRYATVIFELCVICGYTISKMLYIQFAHVTWVTPNVAILSIITVACKTVLAKPGQNV